MREDHRKSADERFGMNVRIMRERKDMSQSALADAMTERGYPWHQQTVGRVEAGRQSVRFGEVEQLAQILKTSMDRFSWGSAEANETEFTYAAGTRVRRQYEVVATAIHRHLADVAAAERLLARPPQTGDSEHVMAAREDVADRLETYSLDNAIEEGIRRYEERGLREEGDDDAQGEA